ncbi:MAG: hypothetical protein JW739_07290 [Opitutales bacterium]|nr:hypothetical protein [Opitutales bacterium]
MQNTHSFHIPVMGTGYTADTPIRVAHLGISSVISLVDDMLLERLRAHYCKVYELHFEPIGRNEEDGRARRITAYLNMVGDIVSKRMNEIRSQSIFETSEKRRYFELLPETSLLKKSFLELMQMTPGKERDQLHEALTKEMRPGSIDVNIMVKLDRKNEDRYGKTLGEEFSDAKAALRGFALSKLESAVVFSAGINQSLYAYTSQFKDFYRDCNGELKKRIVVKISDFRSALTQGKFLAKKGLEVSEFRIESGLNCGGHAFASGCQILPSILKAFQEKRHDLGQQLQDMVKSAYEKMGFSYPEKESHVRVTVQGGIGNSGEDKRLREYYGMDGTGWATPFLLVPEASPVDEQLRQQLVQATENDLELGNNSPLGVPFNTLKNSPAHKHAELRIAQGKPGSGCPKGHVRLRNDYGERALCTASTEFQLLRLKEIEASDMSEAEKVKAKQAALEPHCICHQLGNSALINLGIARYQGAPQSICPGPNIAWFNRTYSLDEMIDHIYGRGPSLEAPERPHMFASEARMNLEYLEKELNKATSPAEARSLLGFHKNLEEGISDCEEVAESSAYAGENLESLRQFVRTARGKLSDLHDRITEKIERLSTALQSV